MRGLVPRRPRRRCPLLRLPPSVGGAGQLGPQAGCHRALTGEGALRRGLVPRRRLGPGELMKQYRARAHEVSETWGAASEAAMPSTSEAASEYPMDVSSSATG